MSSHRSTKQHKSGWSNWEWNAFHGCESRYRPDPSQPDGYRYDYRGAQQTPRYEPPIPAPDPAGPGGNLYPLGHNYTHDSERGDLNVPNTTPALQYAPLLPMNEITMGIAGMSTGSTNIAPGFQQNPTPALQYAPRPIMNEITMGISGMSASSTSIAPGFKQNPRFDKSYKLHLEHEFKRFRVFKVLWSEPQGSNAEGSHDTESIRDTRSGPVHEKVRRFLIICEMKGHCLCLPINTYLKQGTTKLRVQAEHHTIIYNSGTPQYLKGELKKGMTRKPIRVNEATPRDKLAAESRLNYAKVYTVEYNVKVCFIGKIHVDYRSTVVADYNDVHPPLKWGATPPAQSLPIDTFGQTGTWERPYAAQSNQTTSSAEAYPEQNFDDRVTGTIPEGIEEDIQDRPITTSKQQRRTKDPKQPPEEEEDDLYSGN